MNTNTITTALGTPAITLTSITPEAILADTNRIAYNPQEAKKKLEMFVKSNGEFYTDKSGELYCKWNADGVTFFDRFDLFISSMTNRGFRRVVIFETEDSILVYIADINGGRAENCEHNRSLFRKNGDIVTRM
jgi:hypothetical protein